MTDPNDQQYIEINMHTYIQNMNLIYTTLL